MKWLNSRDRLLFSETEICIYTNNHHFLGSSPRKMCGFMQTPDCYTEPGHRGSHFLWVGFQSRGCFDCFPLCRFPGMPVKEVGTPNTALPCPALDKGICVINAPVPLPRDLETHRRDVPSTELLGLGDRCFPNPAV